MELEQKVEKLRGLLVSNDTTNELFFAARNLAIEALLLRLENRLLRDGFHAVCTWKESSFGHPSIAIQLPNPKPDAAWDFATCALHLIRSKRLAQDYVSSCVYSAQRLDAHEYWRGKPPARVVAFRAAVQALHDSGYLANEVGKVNYPFDRGFHSGF